MKLSIKKEVTREVEINPPMFWKEETTNTPVYVALLNEDTAIRLFNNGYLVSIQHTSPRHIEQDIQRAANYYLLCDESEFLRVYSEALEAIRLQPKEHTVNNCMDHEAHNNLKQQISY